MLTEDQAVDKALNKAKTAKGRRILKAREPQVHEPHKKVVFFKGAKTSNVMQNLLTDLYVMRKPDAIYCSNKNEADAHPFENTDRCEHLCTVRQCPLFVMGSTSKKRPNRLVFGRLFNNEMLDMTEFLVTEYKPMSEFKSTKLPQLGSKPVIVFQGAFEQNDSLKNIRSLIHDVVGGAPSKNVVLQGLDRVVVVSAVDSATGDELAASGNANPASNVEISIKNYAIIMEKSGSELPRIELSEIGPSIKMRADRARAPDATLMRMALAVPRELLPKKVKNITTDALGQKRGRIFMEKQDLNKVYTPHGMVESKTRDERPRKKAKHIEENESDEE